MPNNSLVTDSIRDITKMWRCKSYYLTKNKSHCSSKVNGIDSIRYEVSSELLPCIRRDNPEWEVVEWSNCCNDSAGVCDLSWAACMTAAMRSTIQFAKLKCLTASPRSKLRREESSWGTKHVDNTCHRRQATNAGIGKSTPLELELLKRGGETPKAIHEKF